MKIKNLTKIKVLQNFWINQNLIQKVNKAVRKIQIKTLEISQLMEWLKKRIQEIIIIKNNIIPVILIMNILMNL